MSGSMTGGVDASIPLSAGRGVQQTDPLEQIGRFAGIQNALNSAKLFPLEQQRRQQEITIGNQTIQGGGVDLQTKMNQAAAGLSVPLLALPAGGINHGNLTDTLASIEKNYGIPTNGILAHVLRMGPQGDGPEFDAAARAAITAYAQPAASAAAAVTPHAGPMIDNGQQLIPSVVSPQASPTPGVTSTAGTPTQTYPSRQSQLQQVTWEDSQGVKHYGTQADWAKARGQDSLIGPAAPAAGAPAQSLGTGRYAAPQAGDTTGPVPGTVENSQASSLAAHSANQRASTFASDVFPLQQAQTALANAPTGKGSQVAHDVSSYLNTFAPAVIQKGLSFISPVMTPDQVTAYDEAKKYLTQGTLGAPGATRSNEGLHTAGAANPSTEISPDAAKLVLKGMIGLRRMEQDATLAFNKSGKPPADYDKFQTEFATKADLRAYMFDQMTPAERQQTLTSFKDTKKRQAFIEQVQRAEQNGVLSAPGAPNGQ